jgi:protein-tyrosine phosphatase
MMTLSRTSRFSAFLFLGIAVSAPGAALDALEVTRSDDDTVLVRWNDSDPVDLYVSATPNARVAGAPVVAKAKDGKALIKSPVGQRLYIIARDKGDGSLTVAAERLLPLQQGSNFRDLGGYTGAGGKTIRWGKIYRSGAMPLLSERDNRLLASLGITSIIDLRSLEEREVAPTQLDDATGALFISNDYSIKPMFSNLDAMANGNMYADFGKQFGPQYRSLFKRLLADDGAVLYNCSAGQDRTGVASALILSALGVDRKTILADYHKSTEWRRPQWELPKLNPAEHPDNPIVQYYDAASKRPEGLKAEPLYTKDGQSHLAQYFAHLDKEYGGVEAFLQKEMGVGPAEIAKLRKLYLS